MESDQVTSEARPFVDLYCDAPAHPMPVPLERFVLDDRGWRWQSQRKTGGGALDAVTGLREFYDPVAQETAYEVDGHTKVSLDCRKCGLHLPMRWGRWTERLDTLNRAGVTRVQLPALVAILTK